MSLASVKISTIIFSSKNFISINYFFKSQLALLFSFQIHLFHLEIYKLSAALSFDIQL